VSLTYLFLHRLLYLHPLRNPYIGTYQSKRKAFRLKESGVQALTASVNVEAKLSKQTFAEDIRIRKFTPAVCSNVIRIFNLTLQAHNTITITKIHKSIQKKRRGHRHVI